MVIPKIRTNEIAEAIESSDFDSAEFVPDESKDAISVLHTPTGSVLLVNHTDYGEASYVADAWDYVVSWQVGREPGAQDAVDVLGPSTIAWLDALQKDIQTPDLFARLGRETMADLADGQENTPFSTAEQSKIIDLLRTVKGEARETYNLDAHQLTQLEAKIDYLCEAAARVGRKDWLIIAYGVLAGKLVGATLDPHVAQKVSQAIGVGLSALLGHPVLLLGS